ncbi:MAG: 16S rRNA (uracil(1498)-N(3))-methyltransferase [Candidatus Baltobacteraceae bacterium]
MGGVVEIVGGDAHKIAHVLRLREGDSLEIVDAASTLFTATIDAIDGVVRARLLETVGNGPAPSALSVHVAQAVPKGRRMEFVVEKGTELGAAAFLPFHCERSAGSVVGAERLARWRRIARTAAAQSGRTDVPEVRDPLAFPELLERFGEYDVVLFPWELADRIPLNETLPPVLPAAGRALIVVGPEGGFSHQEAESAVERGAALLWLGPRILRTDTAAMALLAVIGAFAS